MECKQFWYFILMRDAHPVQYRFSIKRISTKALNEFDLFSKKKRIIHFLGSPSQYGENLHDKQTRAPGIIKNSALRQVRWLIRQHACYTILAT